ncbi:hypothetical protein GQ53DRAFT_81893 [Thozetella sp. PMI_491]|nr:hypothetical protein GQ53DRAFT_81893 [Thozetella sp. PMI_491]
MYDDKSDTWEDEPPASDSGQVTPGRIMAAAPSDFATASDPSPQPIYIKHDSQSTKPQDMNRLHWLYDDGFAEINLELVDVAPRSSCAWHRRAGLVCNTVPSSMPVMCMDGRYSRPRLIPTNSIISHLGFPIRLFVAGGASLKRRKCKALPIQTILQTGLAHTS